MSNICKTVTLRTRKIKKGTQLSFYLDYYLRDIDKADKCKCQLMEQYVRTGFFGEAVLTMNEIDPRHLVHVQPACLLYKGQDRPKPPPDPRKEHEGQSPQHHAQEFHHLADLYARNILWSRQIPRGVAPHRPVVAPHQARRAQLFPRGILPIPDIRRDGAEGRVAAPPAALDHQRREHRHLRRGVHLLHLPHTARPRRHRPRPELREIRL